MSKYLKQIGLWFFALATLPLWAEFYTLQGGDVYANAVDEGQKTLAIVGLNKHMEGVTEVEIPSTLTNPKNWDDEILPGSWTVVTLGDWSMGMGGVKKIRVASTVTAIGNCAFDFGGRGAVDVIFTGNPPTSWPEEEDSCAFSENCIVRAPTSDPQKSAWKPYVKEYVGKETFHGACSVTWTYTKKTPKLARQDGGSLHSFVESVQIVMDPATKETGVDYRYTLDGKAPTNTSAVFPEAGVALNNSATIRVAGFATSGDKMQVTEIASEYYMKSMDTTYWTVEPLVGYSNILYHFHNGAKQYTMNKYDVGFENDTGVSIAPTGGFSGDTCLNVESEGWYYSQISLELPNVGFLTFAVRPRGDACLTYWLEDEYHEIYSQNDEWQIITCYVGGFDRHEVNFQFNVSGGDSIQMDALNFLEFEVHGPDEDPFVFLSEGGTRPFYLTCNYPFTVELGYREEEPDWLSMAKDADGKPIFNENNELLLTATENTGDDARETMLFVYVDDRVAARFEIRQMPGEASQFDFQCVPVDSEDPEAGALLFVYTGYATSLVIPKTVTLEYSDGEHEVNVTHLGEMAKTNFYEVVVPETVTVIGSATFQGCGDLTHINLPAGLKQIGSSAFSGCYCLGISNFPAGLESIGAAAFAGNSMSMVDIPDSVTTLGEGAFEGCSNLSSARLPSGLTAIPEALFKNCYSLESAVLPTGIQSIGAEAFSGCGVLEEVTLPSGLVSLGAEAFEECYSLTSIAIPDGVEEIPMSCFADCSDLAEVTLGQGVATLEQYCFSGCRDLTTITLPANVTTIKNDCFKNCGDALSIYFDGRLPSSMGTHAFRSAHATLYVWSHLGWIHYIGSSFCDAITVVDRWTESHNFDEDGYSTIEFNGKKYLNGYSGNATELVLPNGIDGIASSFLKYKPEHAENITSITIPETCSIIYEGTFSDCWNLETVYFDGDLPEITGDCFPGTATLFGYEYKEGWEPLIGKEGLWHSKEVAGRFKYNAPRIVRADGYGWSTYAGTTLQVEVRTDALEAGETLHYAIDGGVTTDSPEYSDSIGLTGSQTVSAGIFDEEGHLLSPIATCDFTCMGDTLGAWQKTATGLTYRHPSAGEIVFEGSGWSLQNFETTTGESCAQSAGPTSGSSSVLTSAVDGPGVISFLWKPNIKDYKYKVSFSVDGVEQVVLSESAGWSHEGFYVAGEGEHALAWKIENINDYEPLEGCIYLDFVTFTAGVVDIVMDPENGVLPADGTDSASVAISTASDYPLVNLSSWLTLGEPQEGVYLISATANNGNASRTADLRVKLPYGVLNFGISQSGQPTPVSDFVFSYVDENQTATVIGYNGLGLEVTIPSVVVKDEVEYTVVAIGENAFKENEDITRMVVPATVTTIGANACKGCSSLVEFQTVGDNLATIGEDAFSGCISLTDVRLGDGVKTIEKEAFYYASKLTALPFGEGVMVVGSNAFTGAGLSDEIVLPASVLTWGEGVFSDCQNLSRVVFPADMTGIPPFFLSGCKALEETILPENLEEIGYSAFKSCSSLAHIEFPASLETVGREAFYMCSALTTLEFPASLRFIDYEAFFRCSQLSQVTFAEGLANIGRMAFAGTYLRTIVLPESLETLAVRAFCQSASDTHPQYVYFKGAKPECGAHDEAFNSKMLLFVHPEKDGWTEDDVLIDIYSGGIVVDFYTPIVAAEFRQIEVPAGGFSSMEIPFEVAGEYSLDSENTPDWLAVTVSDGVITFSPGLNDTTDSRQGTIAIVTEDGESHVISTITQGWVDEFTYDYQDSDKTAFVTGYTGSGDAISIPAQTRHGEELYTVIGIQNEAFKSNTNLTSVRFPATIKSIGDSAFLGCTNLADVSFPAGLMDSIGEYAFQGCTKLKSVEFAATAIGQKAFYQCTSLKEAILGEGTETIGNNAFTTGANFSSLENVTLPSTLRSIGDHAFQVAYVKSLDFPENLESIGEEAFGNSSLTSVVLPASLKTLGNGAFRRCYSLKSADLSLTQLTTIPDYAFSNCSYLTSVQLPNSITSIGAEAFSYCSRLAEVSSFTNVVSIGSQAFQETSALASVVFSEHLTAIGNNAFRYSGLTSLALPASLTTWGEYVFAGCSNLESVTAADGLNAIGENAFYNCTALASVELPDSVRTLGANAFYYCSALRQFDCPADLREIPARAFYNCSALKSVDLNDVTSLGDEAFYNCVRLSDIDTGNLEVIGAGAFKQCSALTWVDLENVTSLGQKAFQDSGLVEVVLPACDLSGAIYLFDGCANLESVTLPAGITEIVTAMFRNCTALRSIVIPESVETISSYAFNGDENLTDVLFDGSKPTFSGTPFSGTAAILQVYDREGYGWVLGTPIAGALDVVARMLDAPVISRVDGENSRIFVDSVELTIACADEGVIRYALDGEVTNASAIYDGTIELTGTTTVRAALFDLAGNRIGNIATATYTMNRGDVWTRVSIGEYQYRLPNGEKLLFEDVGVNPWILQDETTYNATQAPQAGGSTNSTYEFSTTVSGFGILTFSWRKSSSYGNFSCIVEGDEDNALSLNETDTWKTDSVPFLEDGEHEIRWILTNYGYDTGTAWLDNIAWTAASVRVVEGSTELDGSFVQDGVLSIESSDDWSIAVVEGSDWLEVGTYSTPIQPAGEGEITFVAQPNYTHNDRTAKIRVTLHNDELFGDTEVFQDIVISQSVIKLPVSLSVEPADSCDVTIYANGYYDNEPLPEECLLPFGMQYRLDFTPKSGYSLAQFDGRSSSARYVYLNVADDRADAGINQHILTLDASVRLVFHQAAGTPPAYKENSEQMHDGQELFFAPGQQVRLSVQGGTTYFRLDHWSIDGEPIELEKGNKLTILAEMDGKSLTPEFVKTVQVTLKCLVQNSEGELEEVYQGDVASNVVGTGSVDADGGTSIGLTVKNGYQILGWNRVPSTEGMTQGGDYYVEGFDWDNEKEVTVYAIFAASATLTVSDVSAEAGLGTFQIYATGSDTPMELDFANGAVEFPAGTGLTLVAQPRTDGPNPIGHLAQWWYRLGENVFARTSQENPLEVVLGAGANEIRVTFDRMVRYGFEARGAVPEHYTDYGIFVGNERVADEGYLPVGTTITLKANQLPSSYTVRWYRGNELVGESNAIETKINSTADLNMFALEFDGVWTLDASVSPNYAGSIAPAHQEATVGYPATVTLSPLANWEVDHWEEDGEEYMPGYTDLTYQVNSPNMASSHTVTAVMRHYSEIIVTVEGGFEQGCVFDGVGKVIVPANETREVTVRANPAAGYQFVCWTDAGCPEGLVNSTERTVVLTENTGTVNLMAKVLPICHVSIGVAEGSEQLGSVTGACENEEKLYGEKFRIQAVANQGAKFLRWSDGSTEAARTITVTGDLDLRASFFSKMQHFSVKATAGQENAGLVGLLQDANLVSEGEAEVGQWYTIQAIPNAGYRFVKWSDGSTDTTRTIKLDENGIDLTASFVGIAKLTVHLLTDPAEIPAGIPAPEARCVLQDGTEMRNGEVRTLEVGDYTLTFNASYIWSNKGEQSITLEPGQDLVVEHVFTLIDKGTVTGYVNPNNNPKVKWRILPSENYEGTVWLPTNTRVEDVPVGEYTVTFEEMAGWIRPEDHTIQVTGAKNTSFTDAYTEIVPAVELLLDPVDVSEAAGTNAVIGTLRRITTVENNPVDLTKAITVNLVAEPRNALLLPSSSITIPKGEMVVQFPIGVVDNPIVEDELLDEQGVPVPGLRGRRAVLTGTVQMSAGCNCKGDRITFSDQPIEAVLNLIDDDGPALAVIANTATVSEREELFERALTVKRNEAVPGDAVSIRLSVYINSEQDVDGTELELWKDGARLPCEDGYYFTEIPAGLASVDVDVKVQMDDVVEDGIQMVSVYADAINAEYSPGSAWMMLNDQSFPDYYVASVETPSNVNSEEDFTLHFTIGNSGNVSIPAGITLPFYVYLTHDNSLREDDRLRPSDSAAGYFTYVFPEEIPVGGTIQTEIPMPALGRAPGVNWRIAVQLNPDAILRETNTMNNVGLSDPFAIGKSYDIVLDPLDDNVTLLPSQVLLITGTTSVNDEPRPNRKVELFAVLNDIRMDLAELESDDEGRFEFLYDPSSNDLIGHIDVGGCYPEQDTQETQIAFDVLGLSFKGTDGQRYLKWDMTTLEPRNITVTLTNPNAVAHENLSFEFIYPRVEKDIEMMVVNPPVGPVDIAPNSTSDVTLQFTAHNQTEGRFYEECFLRVTDDSGTRKDIPVWIYVYPRYASLVAEPAVLDYTIPMNTAQNYEVTLTNNSEFESGEIVIDTPNLNWMSLNGSRILPSLAPHESTTFTLRVRSNQQETPVDAPVSGNLAVNCANQYRGLTIPFNFTAKTEQRGAAKIRVVDDFFYYEGTEELEGAGKGLAQAEVTIKNRFTGEVYAKGLTDEDGYFEADDIPVGKHMVEAYKAQHKQVSEFLEVMPTRLAERQIYLQFQAISYKWEVVRTEIEDQYEVVLHAVYEVHVPVPVVKLIFRLDYRDMEPGTTILENATFVNEGLIRADDVTLTFGESERIILTPLIPEQGFSLNPGEVRVYPVKIEKLVYHPETRGGSGCEIPAALAYSFPCADAKQSAGSIDNVLAASGSDCGGGSSDGGGDDGDGGSGGGAAGGGGGGAGAGGGTASGGMPNGGCSSAGDNCDPDACNPLKPCPVSAAQDIYNGNLVGAVADCTKYVGTAKSYFGCLEAVWRCMGGDAVRSSHRGDSMRSEGLAEGIDDTRANEASVPEYIKDFKDRMFVLSSLIYGDMQYKKEMFGYGDETDDADVPVLNADAEQVHAFLVEFLKLNVTGVDGKHIPIPLDAPTLMLARPAEFSMDEVNRFIALWNRTNAYFDEHPFDDCSLEILDYPDVDEDENGDRIVNPRVAKTKLQQMASATQQMIAELGEESTILDYRNFLLSEYYNARSENTVCAQVVMEIKQTISMTREAFDGTLTMTNGHDYLPITYLGLQPKVTDEDGNDCTELFEIFEVPELANGITSLDGNGELAPQSTGSAVVRFIPENGAAPTTPKVYNFGGHLTYVNPFTGNVASIQLTPSTLTVNPSPKIQMHYFLQEDVISDDPLTKDVVEPAVPAELSVLVRNAGYGEAKNFRIDSGQPEIVDNEKGLAIEMSLWDYSTDKALLNGAPNNAPLGQVCLGTIPPQKTAVAQWWLTTSLMGHFSDMSATYTHLDSHGNPDICLMDSVEIHPLVHSGRALDGEEVAWLTTEGYDFLRNTNGTLYFANDARTEVTRNDVTVTSSAKIEPCGNGEYQMTFTLKGNLTSWYYVCTSSPAASGYEFTKFSRRNTATGEVTELPLDNIWTTAVTLETGCDPVYEDKLHFFDFFPQDAEYEYTLLMTELPAMRLTVCSFDAMTTGGENFQADPEGNNLVESAIDYVKVKFDRPIKDGTFTYEDLMLRIGADILPMEQMAELIVERDSDDVDYTSYIIRGLEAFTAGMPAYHVLTVQCATIADADGYAGKGGYMLTWAYAPQAIDPDVEENYRLATRPKFLGMEMRGWVEAEHAGTADDEFLNYGEDPVYFFFDRPMEFLSVKDSMRLVRVRAYDLDENLVEESYPWNPGDPRYDYMQHLGDENVFKRYNLQKDDTVFVLAHLRYLFKQIGYEQIGSMLWNAGQRWSGVFVVDYKWPGATEGAENPYAFGRIIHGNYFTDTTRTYAIRAEDAVDTIVQSYMCYRTQYYEGAWESIPSHVGDEDELVYRFKHQAVPKVPLVVEVTQNGQVVDSSNVTLVWDEDGRVLRIRGVTAGLQHDAEIGVRFTCNSCNFPFFGPYGNVGLNISTEFSFEFDKILLQPGWNAASLPFDTLSFEAIDTLDKIALYSFDETNGAFTSYVEEIPLKKPFFYYVAGDEPLTIYGERTAEPQGELALPEAGAMRFLCVIQPTPIPDGCKAFIFDGKEYIHWLEMLQPGKAYWIQKE